MCIKRRADKIADEELTEISGGMGAGAYCPKCKTTFEYRRIKVLYGLRCPICGGEVIGVFSRPKDGKIITI